jgi:hypothetical protein
VQVDLDGDDELTEREVRAFITGRRVRGDRRAGAGGGAGRMDFTAFDMSNGAVYARGEDAAGPFILTGTYGDDGRVAMLQRYRPPGGGAGAADAGGPAPVRYAGEIRREESGEVVIRGTWAPAPEEDPAAAAESGAAGEAGAAAGAAAAAGGGEFTLRVVAGGSGRRRLGSIVRDIRL